MSEETRVALQAASRWLREDAERRTAEAARCCAQCVIGAAQRNAENLAAADEIDAGLAAND